jgi:hypothetical protein
MANYIIEDAKRALFSREMGEHAAFALATTIIKSLGPLQVVKLGPEAIDVVRCTEILPHMWKMHNLNNEFEQKSRQLNEEHLNELTTMADRHDNELKTCSESEKPAMIHRHLGESRALESKYEGKQQDLKNEIDHTRNQEAQNAAWWVPDHYKHEKHEESPPKTQDHDRSR